MATDHSDFKLYRYDPSIGAAVVFIILFIIASGIHTYQAAQTKTWFVIPFVVGGHFEWIGYIGRAISGTEASDFTVKPYILQTLLLLIAPTLYAATIYMELGRIVLLTDGETYCLIRRRWLTKIFLIGDIISFIMQGAGGGIMASGTPSALKTGENIIISGLVIQLIFFSLFVITSIKFPPRTAEWSIAQSPSLPTTLGAAHGNDGYLVSHEVYLYIFDAVLMVLVMIVFAWVHPSEVNAWLKPGGGGRAAERVFWLKMGPGESFA
ncbi:RTA1 like protein-domain-containing protein [Aspergillus oleicola]